MKEIYEGEISNTITGNNKKRVIQIHNLINNVRDMLTPMFKFVKENEEENYSVTNAIKIKDEENKSEVITYGKNAGNAYYMYSKKRPIETDFYKNILLREAYNLSKKFNCPIRFEETKTYGVKTILLTISTWIKYDSDYCFLWESLNNEYGVFDESDYEKLDHDKKELLDLNRRILGEIFFMNQKEEEHLYILGLSKKSRK